MDTFEIQTDFISNEFSELASLVESGILNEAAKTINAKHTALRDTSIEYHHIYTRVSVNECLASELTS